MEVINAYRVIKAVDKAVVELLLTKFCNIKTGERSLKFGLSHGKETTQGEVNICSLLMHKIVEADSTSRFRTTNSCASDP